MVRNQEAKVERLSIYSGIPSQILHIPVMYLLYYTIHSHFFRAGLSPGGQSTILNQIMRNSSSQMQSTPACARIPTLPTALIKV
jgi:hypothetical protein